MGEILQQDTVALLKFGIAVAIVAILLIVWFQTVGAPAGEEEEAEEALETLVSCLPAKIASYMPVL